MKYHQVTPEERYLICRLRAAHMGLALIAAILGRHRSTIYRELERNRCRHDGKYRYIRACEQSNGRRSRSRRNSQFSKRDWLLVESLLKRKLSPDQISGRLAKEGLLSISHETIYRHVWNDKKAGGTLYKHLRGALKGRRKRYRSYDSRGRLAGKRPISQRPLGAENRTRFGHWEIDTVMGHGSKHCILTAVDRRSGYLLIGKLRARTVEETNGRLQELIEASRAPFASITADNGTEFHGYRAIEELTGVKFYFATPYHSWERGTNENTNGLVRQYLPKRTSMSRLTQRQCDRIAADLNSRPRKRLGYRTPNEVLLGREEGICVAVQS